MIILLLFLQKQSLVICLLTPPGSHYQEISEGEAGEKWNTSISRARSVTLDTILSHFVFEMLGAKLVGLAEADHIFLDLHWHLSRGGRVQACYPRWKWRPGAG